MPNTNNNIKPITSITVQYDVDTSGATNTVTIKSGDKAAWNALASVDNGRVTAVIKTVLKLGVDFYPSGNTFVTVNR